MSASVDYERLVRSIRDSVEPFAAAWNAPSGIPGSDFHDLQRIRSHLEKAHALAADLLRRNGGAS